MDPGGGGTERSGGVTGMAWPDRLRWEMRWSYPMLSVVEPSVGGRRVEADLAECLAPRRTVVPFGRCPVDAVPVVRAALLVWALHAVYVDFTVYYPPHNWWYYMIYLTHWGQVLNTTYLACSLVCCLFLRGAMERWQGGGRGDDGVDARGLPPLLARVTWSLYSLAAPLAIAIAVLYWSALVPAAGGIPTNGPTLYHIHFGRFIEKYGGGGPGRGGPMDLRASTYAAVMEHGVVGLLVLLDGARVGTVPVRAKQVFVLMALCAMYLAWSYVHCILGVGVGKWDGPMWDDDDGDDDAIYPVLNWCGGDEDRKLATYVSTFAILVLAPLSFWAVWMLSLSSPKEKAPKLDLEQRQAGHDGDFGLNNGRHGGGACWRCWNFSLCPCCCCRWKWDGSRRPVHVESQTQEDAFAYEMHGDHTSVV